MFKKILFTAILMLSLLCLTQTALAAGSVTEVYDGYSLEYSYADGNASVSKIRNVTGSSLNIEIPAVITVNGTNYNVTAIGNGAFRGNTYVKSVTGSSIVTIDELAFYNCANLTFVSFPKAASAGKWSFTNCRNLTSVSLPNTDTLGMYAFQNCSALKNVSLPNVSVMSDCSFRNCTNLTSLSCPDVTKIGQWSFTRCPNLTSVEISDSNPYFYTDSYALFERNDKGNVLRLFLNNSGGSYQSDCDVVGEFAFYGRPVSKVCLTRATNIDEAAFSDCSELDTVILGPSITEFGNLTFINCTNLKAVYFVGSSVPSYNETNSFGNVSNEIIFYCYYNEEFDWKNLSGTKGIFDFKIYNNDSEDIYTVRFDRNGGSGIPIAFLTTRGEFNIIDDYYERENMAISYWSTNADGTGEIYSNGDMISVSNDIVLFAQWIPAETPTEEPWEDPTEEPWEDPTEEPWEEPTEEPWEEPTEEPWEEPTVEPIDLEWFFYSEWIIVEPSLPDSPIYTIRVSDSRKYVTINDDNHIVMPIKIGDADRIQGITVKLRNVSGADVRLNMSESVLNFSGDSFTINYIDPDGYTNADFAPLYNIDITNFSTDDEITFEIDYKISSGNKNVTNMYVGQNPIRYSLTVSNLTTEHLQILFDESNLLDLNDPWELEPYFIDPAPEYGDTITIPEAVCVKEGYVFDYWSTSKNGSGVKFYPGNSYVVSENTTFYAQWKEVVTGNRIIYDFSDLAFDENMTNGNRSDSVPVFIQNADRVQGIDVQIENISNATVRFANADGSVGTAEISDDGTHITIRNPDGYTGTAQKYLFDVIITDALNGSVVNFDLNFEVMARSRDMTETYVKVNPDNVNVIVPGPVSCSVVYKDGIVGKADHIPKSEDVDPGTDYHVSDFRAIREGYVFTGWLDDNGEYVAPGDSLIITGNKELTAQWIPLEDGFTPRLRDVINLNQIILNHGNFVKNYDIDKNGRLNIFDLVYLSQYVADN